MTVFYHFLNDRLEYIFGEKLMFAITDIAARNSARAPFLSGFARLLRAEIGLLQHMAK